MLSSSVAVSHSSSTAPSTPVRRERSEVDFRRLDTRVVEPAARVRGRVGRRRHRRVRPNLVVVLRFDIARGVGDVGHANLVELAVEVRS